MRQLLRQRHYLTLLILSAAPVFGQSTFPDCGYLNGPTCSFFSSLYWSNASGACDWGLASSNGTCVMGGRQTLPYDQSWVVWALNNQQRYSIGAGAAIDQVLTLGTHNSYSSSRQGFLNSLTTDQVLSITDQLNWGMRSIRLDPAHYSGDWRVCHNSGTWMCSLPTVSSNRLFAFAVEEVADWLNAHPGELIYLSLNSSDTDTNGDLEPILKQYISPSKFFTYDDWWFTYSKTWPTMGQLLKDHKQVVLFSYGCCEYSGHLGWSFQSDIDKITPADQNFPSCHVNTSNGVPVPISGLGDSSATEPTFSQVGEDRSGSAATLGWGVVDPSQVVTAAACGFSNVELDFANNLIDAFVNFKEFGPDLRREAAVWSWAPNDYGTLGPAVMRVLDGRWTSAPSGTNYGYACAIDTDGNTTVQAGNTRHRNWYIAGSTGTWSNGSSACAATTVNTLNGNPINTPVSGYFAFPRNGKENNDLQIAALKAGMTNLWLNYSAQSGGSGLIVKPNPVPLVPVIHGSAAPPLVFDISTSVIIPPAGATLTVTLNLATGTITNQTTITSQSVLWSYPLPSQWSTSQNPGNYPSSADIKITSLSGTLLAETSLPFTISVLAGTTTTITSVTNPVDEGAASNFQINVTSNEPSIAPNGNVQIFELIYDPVTNTNKAQNILPPTIWAPGLGALISLPPGNHLVGARFTPAVPLEAASESAPLTQVVNSYINPSPSSLTFTMDAGGALPAGQSFSGKAFGQPTITSNANWVAPFSLSGNEVLFTATIQPTPAAQSLSPGQYNAQITASDNAHVPQNVAITLNVRGPLQLSSNSISFLTSGADYSTVITLLQGGTFPLQINGGTNWASLQVIPDPSSAGHFALLLDLNPQGLEPGRYNTHFQVNSTLASNGASIGVDMTVVPPVIISANLAGVTAVIDDTTYSLPHTFTWQPGSPHTISTATQYTPFLCIPLPGNPCPNEVKYSFTGWDSGSAGSQSITAPTKANDKSSWQASFLKSWLLTTSAVPAPAGSISVNPTSPSQDGYYPDSSTVQITATANPGYTFAGFSGSLQGTTTPQNLLMFAPRNVTAAFVQGPVTVTIDSQATGLPVTVDGGTYQTPATFTWQQGSNHTVAFGSTIAGAAGTQYLFQNWFDGPFPPSRTITAGSANATYVARFRTQYYLNASPSPASGGSVTGSGWYDAGSNATLQAIAATGFQFSSYSSDPITHFNTTQNPAILSMNAPKTVAANFGPSGNPIVFASLGGTNSDDSNGNHVVPITLKNVGAGAALGVQVTISNINVTLGSGGPVTVVGGPFPAPPTTPPDLAPNGSTTINVPFQWPTTATRIQIKVNFTANAGSSQGTYSGSTTLNLFR